MKKISLFLFMLLSLNILLFPNIAMADRTPLELYSTKESAVGGKVSFLLTGEWADGNTFYIEYDKDVLEYVPESSTLYRVSDSTGRLDITISRSPAIDPPQFPFIEFKVKSTTKTSTEVKINSYNSDVASGLYNGITREIKIVGANECPRCENKECPSCEVKENPDTPVDDKTNAEDTKDLAKDDSKSLAENATTSSNDIKDVLLYATIGSNLLLVGVIVVLILRNRKKKSSAQVNNNL